MECLDAAEASASQCQHVHGVAGDATYYTDVNTYYQLHLANEATLDAELITNWDNLFWASNVLLANITGSGAFHQASQAFFKQWVCGSGGIVK